MTPTAATPPPPTPFDPAIATIASGTPLFRVHSNRRRGDEFNPGFGGASRYGFFCDDLTGSTVPLLYAAASELAAIAETLLHDVPLSGGLLAEDDYGPMLMSRLRTTRPLRLAVLHGLGLRRLGVSAAQLTDTDAAACSHTARWGAAAFDAGLDGAVWMSKRCNDAKAYVLYDRSGLASEPASAVPVAVDPTFARVFATGADLEWLIDVCAPLRVDVLPPGG